MVFECGRKYTREEIGQQLGGSRESYLPRVKRHVVCGCFELSLNPKAPNVVLVGNGSEIMASARQFAVQPRYIPIFIKRANKSWEYVGDYRVSRFDDSVKTILEEARLRDNPSVTRVLYLERKPS
jgi:hypothetical protein